MEGTRRIVVTGGAGFIGANLVRALRRSGEADEVTVIDDLSTGRAENLAGLPGVVLVVGSITDPLVLDGAIPGAFAVVHLAAQASVPRSMADPVHTNETNVTGTVRVLEAARRAGGIQTIVASSAAVYGDDPAPVKHESLVPTPASPYAVSKLATEAYALTYGACFGLPTLALRFFNVFGPLQPADHVYAAAIPAFVAAALVGDALPVHGDGSQVRDFVPVDAVTTVIRAAIRRRVTSAQPVNLASGRPRRLLDVAAVLERILERPLPRTFLPRRPGDVHMSVGDDRRLAALFPEVRVPTFEPALCETVEWYRTGVVPGDDRLVPGAAAGVGDHG